MGNRKVFSRDKGNSHGFQVTATDLAAVDDVGLYRLLLGQQLLQLHWPNESQRRHGESRLRGLFHQGWLDRQPFYSSDGRPLAIYGLGRLGRQRVAANVGMPMSKLGPRPSKEMSHTSLFIRHHLLTVQIAINLRQAAESLGGEVALYEDERSLRAGRRRMGGSQAMIPDAFMVLSINSRVQSVCIEADRATVDMRSWQERINGYWGWSKTGDFRERLQSPAILVVVDAETQVAERRVSALQRLVEAEANKTGNDPSFFWISTLRESTVDAILSRPIWRVGGQARSRSLLPEKGEG
jgi:hypothetical protein